jgi:hypothetical protein
MSLDMFHGNYFENLYQVYYTICAIPRLKIICNSFPPTSEIYAIGILATVTLSYCVSSN